MATEATEKLADNEADAVRLLIRRNKNHKNKPTMTIVPPMVEKNFGSSEDSRLASHGPVAKDLSSVISGSASCVGGYFSSSTLSDLLNMIPGMGQNKHLKNLEVDDKELVKIEAIINSMTPQERRQHTLIKGSRRKRIAKGSGTSVQDINKLLKNYAQVVKMIQQINKGGMRGIGRGMLPF